MSEALQLLNSLNLEDYIDPNPVNDVLTIDANGRITHVPGTEILLGVEGDHRAERKYFTCPKIVGDNIDLSTLSLQVKYKNSKGEPGKWYVDDVRFDGDYITFSWLIEGVATAYEGSTEFSVVAVKVNPDDDANVTICWGTTTAKGNVLKGLPVDELDYGDEYRVRDAAAQLLDMMSKEYVDEKFEDVVDEIIVVQEILIGGDA